MFNDDFFPTPFNLVLDMLEPYREILDKGAMVLEPSAGKGDIADRIKKQYYKSEVLCIEKDDKLRSILHDEGYKVIGEDFLEYQGGHAFDLIIMNPPFSAGARHLLHAWEILPGGHIVCLLNEETIKNPYTQERRQLARLIEDHGSVEYKNQAFLAGERRTGVGVALVRLKKEPDEAFDFFGGLDRLTGVEFDVPDSETGLIKSNVLADMEDSLALINRLYGEHLKMELAMQRASAPFFEGSHRDCVDMMYKLKTDGSPATRYNRFVVEMNRIAWEVVFRKVNFSKFLTSKLRQDFQTFQKQQGQIVFSRRNVMKFIESLMMNQGDILQQCVVGVFDEFTAYHDCNRVHWEGWKTNDAFKVTKKVILPYLIRYEPHYLNKFAVQYSRQDFVGDIDKAMCYVSGERIENIITVASALEQAFKHSDLPGACESTFFYIRYYLKGTVHLTFRSEKLYEQFNLAAAKGKNWLPGNFNTNA